MNAERLNKLKAMEQAKPDDAFLKFAIAQEYANMDNDKDALVYYELLLQNFPQYVPTYYQLGKLYEKLNKVEKAKTVYQTGVEKAKAARDLKTAAELKEALILLEDE